MCIYKIHKQMYLKKTTTQKAIQLLQHNKVENLRQIPGARPPPALRARAISLLAF